MAILPSCLPSCLPGTVGRGQWLGTGDAIAPFMETIIIAIIVLAFVMFSCLVAADSAASRALAVELAASEEADELAADSAAWLDETEAALSGPLAAVEWELAVPCRVTARDTDSETCIDAVIAGRDDGDDAYSAAMRRHGYERKADRAMALACERAYNAHKLSAYRQPAYRTAYPPM